MRANDHPASELVRLTAPCAARRSSGTALVRPVVSRTPRSQPCARAPRAEQHVLCARMVRVLSGVQPTGEMHLGNYLGAFRSWSAEQYESDAFFCIVDLHAITVDFDPKQLASRTLHTATSLLAAGLDPSRCTIFVQSQVHEHSELAWILECTATMGEMRRMTQLKEKGAGQESVSLGLFAYPVLMAADILAYDADRVPVGDDQRQHLELARDLAHRFNARYGETFVVPDASVPRVASRVMDLQDPTSKMSKSAQSHLGTIMMLDDPTVIERKIRRAVTDSGTEVLYDPENKPGISNLLELLAAASGGAPDQLASGYPNYGSLKSAATEAVAEMLRPARERFAAFSRDPGEVRRVLSDGAQRAGEVAASTLRRTHAAIGILT